MKWATDGKILLDAEPGHMSEVSELVDSHWGTAVVESTLGNVSSATAELLREDGRARRSFLRRMGRTTIPETL